MKKQALVLMIGVAVLALAGCGIAATETQVPRMEPTPQADIVYEGISFSYDDALATGADAETVPASEFMGTGETIPEHIEFTFTGYMPDNTLHQPRIYVYPVDALMNNSLAAPAVTELRSRLEARPELQPNNSQPFLPLFNAAQVFTAKGAYLDFHNGSGIRYLTQFDQAFLPINNYEMFYTFQGLTDDGTYYVAAILPATNPLLPADQTPLLEDIAFVNDFPTYVSDITGQVQAADAASFTPQLWLLDGMIETLEVK